MKSVFFSHKYTLRLLALMAVLIFTFGSPRKAIGQSTYSWGSSSTNSGNDTYANPFGRYFGWEYRIFLYPPNTMPFAGNISKLEFLPAGTQSSTGGQIDVWMKTVTDISSLNASTTFATYKSGATLVYSNSSSPSYTSGTYVSIPLSTTIPYNNNNNEYMMILVRSVANSSTGDGSTKFYYYNPSGASNNTWYKKQDNSDPGQSVSGTTGAYLPVIRWTYSTTYTVSYNANGGSGTMTDPNSPYTSGSTVTVLNNSFTPPSGKTFSKWNTQSGGGGTDYNPGGTFSISGNTTLYAQWVDDCPSQSVPFSENFNSSSSLPSCWTQEYDSHNLNWTIANNSSYGTGSNAAKLSNTSSGGNYTTKLITPKLNLDSYSSATLTFKHTQVVWGSDQDQLCIYYRTSPSASWVQLGSCYTNSITATGTTETFTLPAAACTSTCQIAFEGHANYGRGVYVDDVNVTGVSLTLTATVNNSSYGYVQIDGSPSGGTTSTTANLNQGATAVISAIPADGYVFTGWTKSGTGATLSSTTVNPTTFTMGSANATVTANFAALRTTPALTGDSGTSGFGGEGYTNLFDNATSTKYCTGSLPTVTFHASSAFMPQGYILTTANDTYDSDGDRNPKAWTISGSSSSSGPWTEIDSKSNITSIPVSNYTSSSTFNISSRPDQPYQYYKFAVSSLQSGSTFQLSEFDFIPYPITCIPTVGNPNNGYIEATFPAPASGNQVTVTIHPDSGYKLGTITAYRTDSPSTPVALGAGDGGTGDGAYRTFTMPSYDVTVEATFVRVYTVAVSANPSGSGTLSGGGNYEYGQSCTVTATPSGCYRFVNWTENGSQVSTNASYTFTISSDRNLVANFEEWPLSISSNLSSLECITSGTQVVLTATSDLATLDKYTFTTGTSGTIYSPSWTQMVASGNDDAASNLFDIGFPFVYDGVTYEKFSANSNGRMRLGDVVIGTTYSNPFGSSYYTGNTPAIVGVGRDCSTGSSGYVKTGLYGSTGSRIRVIEFMLNTSSSTSGTTYIKFQIQLFEATGEVRIVYSNDYSNAPSSYQIGIGNASHNRFWYVNPSNHTATYSTTYTSTTYSVFPGGTRYYSFKPAVTFAWSCTSGTSGTASGTNYTVSPTASTNTYTVTATSSGCTQTASATVTVQQVAPTNVNVSNVTATTATVSWTSSASSWEYSIDGGNTWVAAPSNPMTITGLSPNTTYTVKVRTASATCPSDPATSSSFTTCGEAIVGDHSGTSTNNYLPSYNYYNYSYTQQIYTPCEVGVTGNLNGIAFYNGGTTKTRTYDIYLVTTTKDVFSGTSDWITVSASNKVFSGSVTMTSGTWTWIAFNTTFNYNGASNLAVIVDDNTGDYTSSPHMACRVYNANGYQAIYQYSDDDNNNPLSPSYAGTRLTVKNQLKFSSCDMVTPTQVHVTVSANDDDYGSVSGGGCFLQGAGSTTTVTATPNACYEFVNWTENGVEVSTSDTYTFTVTGDRDLVANFQDTWTVNPNSANVNTECITSGTQVVLTARPSFTYNATDYTFTRTTGSYTELSSPTTLLAPTTGTDPLTCNIATFPDGFTFNYCGTTYTGIYISDGQMRFGSSSMSYSQSTMLSSTSYYNILAPFLTDLYLKANTGTITYQLTGTAPSRVLTIQFKNVTTYSDNSTTNYFNFQVKLYENGTIEFCYGSGFNLINAYYSSAYTCIGINNNSGGTTYYQQITPTSGGATVQTSGTLTKLTVAQAHYITSGTIYRFTPPITYAWSCTSGTSGTASGNTYTVSPTASTNTYTVTATSNGCSKTSTVTVTVKDAMPTGVTITNVTSTTATASWTSSASSSWEYRLNGGSWVTTSSNPVNLTGLTPGTNYTFEVRTAGTTCPSDPGTGTFTTLSLYTLTVSTNPSGSGFTATGGGTYEAGTSHTVNTSTTNSNYVFAFWWNEGTSTVASTNASFSYGPLNSNTTLVAYYAPLSIANATQWAEFSTVINRGFSYSGRTVPLTADISLSGYTGGPAGTGTNPFEGSFDGNGHCITNYSSSNVTHNGLFGYVSGIGNISNVIVNATLSGTSDAVGAIVGTFASSGTISNVEGAGSVSSSSANANIGGLVGNMTNGTLHSSFAVNSLSSTQSSAKVGGLVGTNSGNLYNSYSNVTINATPTTKGGLVGIHGSGKFVANCYAALGSQSFPAFAYTNNGTIEYCYADVANGYVNSGNAPSSHGTFSAVQSSTKHLNYMYRDNLITLASGSSTTYVPASGTVTYVDNHIPVWNGLVSALNQWVRANPRNINGLAPWFRPLTTNINGDLPVLGFPKDNALATLNSDGKFLQYGSKKNGSNGIDALLTAYNGGTAASIFHYGKAKNVVNVPSSNVNVYIAEDAALLQATSPDPGAFNNTTVGVTFDNSDHGQHAFDFWGNRLLYDWHFMSSPLYNPLTGAEHSSYDPSNANSDVDITAIGGYFPTGLPMALHDQNWKWDFYTYYEPEYHWINLKRNKKNHYHQDGGALITYNEADQDLGDHSAHLIPGKGYMMAISQNTFMNQSGTLNRGNVPITLTNQENNPDGVYGKGWNLVGNPYQAYLDLETMDRLPVYIYDAEQGNYVPYAKSSSSNPVLPSRYIHPHQAFFMHSNSGGTTEPFTFLQSWADTITSSGSYYRDEHLDYPLVNLFAENSIGQRDLAIIEFHRPEIGGAPKLEAMRNVPFTLAAHHNGTSYGILFATDDLERVPVHFKTDEDAQMTLTWNTYNGIFSKLYLVDNIMGVTYDMLNHDSYNFVAHATDYSSRFYITYECLGIDEDDDSGGPGGGSFVYVSNGNIVVEIDTGSGTSLQLIDMLGRVLYSTVCTDGVHTISTNRLAKGVYVVRLATNKGVKTQKIVVQ